MISFAVDNRLLSDQCFYTEAALSTFHRNIACFIGKFCTVSNLHPWLNFPTSLLVALSPERVRQIARTEWDISRLNTVLESRYSCLRPLQKTTWGRYFPDAVKKAADAQSATNELEHTIIVFSSDFCLLGESPCYDLEEGLYAFCDAAKRFKQKWQNGRIIIMCGIVSENTKTDHYYASPNLIKVQRALSTLASFVTFRGVKNAQCSFDEELRHLASHFAHPLYAKVDLPSQHGANCSVVVELQAATYAAQSSLHDGLCAPTFVALVPRSGVDAAYLEGGGLFVRCPASTAVADMLPTKNR
jgi:hypothetical protein